MSPRSFKTNDGYFEVSFLELNFQGAHQSIKQKEKFVVEC